MFRPVKTRHLCEMASHIAKGNRKRNAQKITEGQLEKEPPFFVGTWSVALCKTWCKGQTTDLFKPLLKKMYPHITSSDLFSSELFHKTA